MLKDDKPRRSERARDFSPAAGGLFGDIRPKKSVITFSIEAVRRLLLSSGFASILRPCSLRVAQRSDQNRFLGDIINRKLDTCSFRPHPVFLLDTPLMVFPLRITLAVAICFIATLQFAPTVSAVDIPSYITPASTYDENNKTIQNFYPQYDENNPLRYLPSQALAIVATVLYALVALVLFIELKIYGQKWMLTLIIGSFCYAIGMALRLAFRKDPHTSGIYIALYMFTVLSPCAFIATDYVLLGRLVRHLGMNKHLRIKAHKTTKIFVGSDIVTFLIQASGGGLASSKNPTTNDIGSKIFLAGIILQMISFFLFTFLVIDFGLKLGKHEPQIWTAPDRDTRRWKQLYYAMLWTCIGFIIRSVFRTVELSQGFRGHLSTTEVYVYVLDTLPLFLAIIAYIAFYPGRYLRPDTAGAHEYAYEADGTLKVTANPTMEMKPVGRTWYRRKQRA